MLGLSVFGIAGVGAAIMIDDLRQSHARTERALQDLAESAARYGDQEWWPARERITRASIAEDAPSGLSWLLSVGMGALAVGALVAAIVLAWRASRAYPTALFAHRARLERLATTWARVVRTETVGSRSTDDRLTHYELALELHYWPSSVPSGYRQGQREPLRCSVRWAIEAAAAGHVVPGVIFGLAYDRDAPDQVDAMIPQALVTLSGAMLPLR